MRENQRSSKVGQVPYVVCFTIGVQMLLSQLGLAVHAGIPENIGTAPLRYTVPVRCTCTSIFGTHTREVTLTALPLKSWQTVDICTVVGVYTLDRTKGCTVQCK